jgi:predicted O-methyltransferase YrrM
MPQTSQPPGRILIVGASEGEAVLALALALPPDGRMICIEGDRAAAARAVESFTREGLAGRVSVMTGDPALFVRKVAGPYDLIAVAVDPVAAARIGGRLASLLAPGGRILTL